MAAAGRVVRRTVSPSLGGRRSRYRTRGDRGDWSALVGRRVPPFSGAQVRASRRGVPVGRIPHLSVDGRRVTEGSQPWTPARARCPHCGRRQRCCRRTAPLWARSGIARPTRRCRTRRTTSSRGPSHG